MAYTYKITPEMHKILPVHYLRRCLEFNTREMTPLHWEKPQKQYTVDDEQRVVKVDEHPIPVIFPPEANDGLWGGEGLIKGYVKRTQEHPAFPRIWGPCLSKEVLYSEILDKCLHVTVTKRVIRLIDDSYGIDTYILKTHERDLNSRLAMTLKRQMLLTLAYGTLYPDDAEKRDKILNKYRNFIIPAEEAEWIGLPLEDAIEKATAIYEENHPVVPKKEILSKIFIEEMKVQREEEQKISSLDKLKSTLNPFVEDRKGS